MRSFRVILLGSSNSIHLQRWANQLSLLGLDIHLISIDKPYNGMHEHIRFHKLPFPAPLGYLLNAFVLKKLIRKIKPDLVNAHYATGYGLLSRLAGFNPILLSVWGSDIYEFPTKSSFHLALLRSNLKSSTAIASTSQCMATRCAEIYSHPSIFLTPFGIDVNHFRPLIKPAELAEYIVVGTVKTLGFKYGIDILLRAFALAWVVLSRPPNLILEITGGGPDRQILENLASDLNIASQVKFFGAISHEHVPAMLNRLDIYVALSRAESFGVAILEASACEKPVLVSDAEGLVEVVKDDLTGLIVPIDNPEAASNALVKLIQDSNLRSKMGRAGRQHVIDNYSWPASLDLMLKAQEKTIELGQSQT